MPVDVTVLLAVVLAVLYTLRKLDVQRREPEQFPNVARADFERWKARQTFAYNLASFACVGKVAVDIAMYFLHSKLPWSAVRAIGGTASLAWVAALVVSVVLGSGARKLRDELGIDLTRPPQEQG
jgi:hypothetical protein